MAEDIGLNPESVGRSIVAISNSTGLLPSDSAITRYEGPQTGVTGAFYDQVGYAATTLANLVGKLSKELILSEQAVRQTVADMVTNDESLSDEARTLLGAVDAITDSSAADPAVRRSW